MSLAMAALSGASTPQVLYSCLLEAAGGTRPFLLHKP